MCEIFIYAIFNFLGLLWPGIFMTLIIIVVFHMAIQPITWSYIEKTVPDKGFAFTNSIGIAMNGIIGFVSTYLLNSWLKTGGTFTMFGIITLVGATFITVNMGEVSKSQ